MRKLLLLGIAMLGMSFTGAGDNFCDGWEDGYQQALDDCIRVSYTPLCPLEPINSDGYKTGFGMGYASAKEEHCDE